MFQTDHLVMAVQKNLKIIKLAGHVGRMRRDGCLCVFALGNRFGHEHSEQEMQIGLIL